MRDAEVALIEAENEKPPRRRYSARKTTVTSLLQLALVPTSCKIGAETPGSR